ncbi:brain protein I3 isoform X7 [Heterocephalus glaber]|uniref:Brain protein I3 isoform X7 n=1 Tax=Heterocephalus glaber TaxID=10181 RepID=A0AAX6NZT8_HETGA|nr:brain protein I3 isoform X7 [Heterocephalus glaber]
MDHKPLLQERPPAYNLEAGQADCACGAPGYGAIPSAPPPPPYPYLVTGIPTPHPRVYSIHSRTVTRYPANSIVVVGGCPVCRCTEACASRRAAHPSISATLQLRPPAQLPPQAAGHTQATRGLKAQPGE